LPVSLRSTSAAKRQRASAIGLAAAGATLEPGNPDFGHARPDDHE